MINKLCNIKKQINRYVGIKKRHVNQHHNVTANSRD
jgi:hypothetical protein